MPAVLREFKPLVKNTLRGFAAVELPNGLIIGEITLHNSHGKVWANLPGAAQLENGSIRVVDGKPQYKKIISWRDRDLSDRFSETVCDLVREKYPRALD